MAARWNLKDFLNRKHFFFLLALVIGSVYVTGGAADSEILGKIGGNVTFRCPVEPKKLKMLYLQKGDSFVNGFFESRNITNKWQNTQMDEKNMVVHMHSLNVSHEGSYQCIIEYYNDLTTKTPVIHLKITGDFSKPEVIMLHHDKSSWTMMCSSHGGYPSSKMIWNTNGSRMVKVLNRTEIRDPVTLTINSSSTAVFNCSKDEIQFISCSVRGVTSAQFSVCTFEPDDTSNSTGLLVIVAIALVVIITCIIGIAAFVKMRKKCRRAEGAEVEALTVVRTERVNENSPETLLTKEGETMTGGKDAP